MIKYVSFLKFKIMYVKKVLVREIILSQGK